jgi:hypothetical protein
MTAIRQRGKRKISNGGFACNHLCMRISLEYGASALAFGKAVYY